MDHVHVNLLGRELDERVGKGLHRTVHVSLDDDIELLEVADGDAPSDFLEGHVLLGLDALDPYELLAPVGDGLGLLLVCHDVELVTGARGSVESEYGYRG